MLKRSVRYSIIATSLALAILLQPMWPAIIFVWLTASLSDANIAQGGWPGFGLDLPPQAVPAEPKLDLLSLPEFMGASPALAQSTSDCAKLYLPLILKAARPGASTGGAVEPAIGAEALLPGLEFAIISPRQGWTISGMLFFAAQPLNSVGVTSVTFQAGSTILGTDSTPADGFKVFLNASTFPAGPLQLTATASGACGQLTKTITVNVVPNPPSSGTIGSSGGVFASQIGSIITVPPNGVPNGTTITVTEKTQAQTTAEHGIDWDAMGVTFLGAQDLQSTAPFALPLGVASAGFGNRVQPGQAVVNYNIIPDADGDGIDEIVVVNTASVAPNNDVIADPVPQILLGEATTTSSAGISSIGTLQAGISGPPGTVIKIKATGFNPYSSFGNVAIYHSSVNGTELAVPAFVEPDFNNAPDQTIVTFIPPLPPVSAMLTLHNKSTGSIAGSINITVEPSPSLSKPAAEIIDDFLALTIDTVSQVSTLATEIGKLHLVAEASRVISKTNKLQSLIQQISINPTPEDALFLTNLAVMIENSGILNNFSLNALPQTINPQFSCDDVLSPISYVGILFGSASTLATLGAIGGTGSAVIAGLGPISLAIAAGLFALGTAILVGLTLYCLNPNPRPPLPPYWGCRLRNNPDLCPIFINGMGSAPPSGGNGPGNAPAPPPPPTSTVNALNVHAAGVFDQQPGGIVVKVLSNGFPIPFTGVTDAGGYFFIPLIPAGEPFVATAIDTVTERTRTFRGIGPAVGESVFMFFDFLSDDGPTANTITWDGGGNGTAWHDPLNWNPDRLPAITDTVGIDVPGNITITHSQGNTVIASLHSAEALVISGGSLAMDFPSEISNTLTLSNGTLDGAGTLTVTGTLTWTGGTMGGFGRTIANGGLTISGAAHKLLSGRTLDNAGAATWSGLGLILTDNGAVFNNLPGATFEVQTDAQLGGATGSPLTFNNMGALTKSTGVDRTSIQGFTNTGTVTAQTGILTLDLREGGTSSGSFNVAAGATLELCSGFPPHTLDANSTLTGAGDVRFQCSPLSLTGAYNVTGHTDVSASVNFGRDTTIPRLTLTTFGTLTGTATLTVTDALTWTGGAMEGLGRTVASGLLTISGGNNKSIRGRTLDNVGAAIWRDTGILTIQGGGIFNNLPGATFETQNDASLQGASTGTFNNAGSFIKFAGVGATTLNLVFNNIGTTDVQTGTMTLLSGGASSGSFAGATGTTLNFGGGTHTLAASSSVSFPNVIFSAGTVNLAGAYAASGSTSVGLFGTVNFNPGATVTDVGNPVTINGGTANFNSGNPITMTAVVLSGGGTLTGASDLTVTSVLSWTAGTLSGSGRTVANGGLNISGSGSKILDTRVLENNGAATWSGTGDISGRNGASLSNTATGTFNIQTDRTFLWNLGARPTFVNAGAVTKSAGGGLTTIEAAFNNSGTVAAQTGALNFAGGYTQSAGATNLNGGHIAGSTFNIQGGSLSGAGIITATVAITGQVNPGGIGSSGVLTIAGNYVHAPAGVLNIELGGLSPAQYDRLNVSGSATLNGTLNVSEINGFTPTSGDNFQVMNYGSRSGTFATINGPYSPTYNATNLTIQRQ